MSVSENVRLVKNTAILALGQFIPKLMTLITLPLLTGYLDADGYGVYDLIVSIANLAVPLFSLQIYQALLRFLISSNSPEDASSYISNALACTLSISFLTVPVTALFSSLFFDASLSILISISYFAESLYYLFGQIARGFGNNLVYSIGAIIYSIFNLLLLYVLVVFGELGINGVIGSIAGAYLLSTFYLGVAEKAFHRINFSLVSKKRIGELLSFSIPLVPNSISVWAVNFANRIIVTAFLGSAANGIYAVACKFPNIYNTAYNVFNLAWVESASRAFESSESNSYYQRTFSHLFHFLLGVMLLLLAASPILFDILVDESFSESYSLMFPQYVGVLFSSISYFFGGIAMATKKTSVLATSSIVGAVTNVLLTLGLIGRFGIIAAAIASSISYLVMMSIRAVSATRQIELSLPKREIAQGAIAFSINLIASACRTPYAIALCFLVAAIYNVTKNKEIIIKFLHVVHSGLA